jgi:GxxExxY protein
MENLEIVNDQQIKYNKTEGLLYADLTYEILGGCMNVHKELGRGFLEIVYKDALEIEFKKRGIFFQREKKYEIFYDGILLPHYYQADFVIDEKVILEVKSQQGVIDEHYKQVLNYLAVSKCKLGLLVNFGQDSLQFKRLVL